MAWRIPRRAWEPAPREPDSPPLDAPPAPASVGLTRCERRRRRYNERIEQGKATPQVVDQLKDKVNALQHMLSYERAQRVAAERDAAKQQAARLLAEEERQGAAEDRAAAAAQRKATSDMRTDIFRKNRLAINAAAQAVNCLKEASRVAHIAGDDSTHLRRAEAQCVAAVPTRTRPAAAPALRARAQCTAHLRTRMDGRRTELRLAASLREIRGANIASHARLFGTTAYTSWKPVRREKVIVKRFRPVRGEGGARVRP
jgi:hypothetical protein